MRKSKSQAKQEIYLCPDVLFTSKEDVFDLKGKWNKNVFKNFSPIHLELGIGKGRFITELAHKNPDINYVGIELKEERLMSAVKKIDSLKLNNVRLLFLNIFDLENVFKENEIDRIYINFPDPWTKKRHHKKRMTCPYLLSIYKNILKPKGTLHLKTDNEGFFEDSCKYFTDSQWRIISQTDDLQNDENNICTEFEKRYRERGMRICKLIA